MEDLIKYSLEAYTRKELALSKNAKASIISHAKSAEELYGKCKEILVVGRWKEPFTRIDTLDYITTWRFYVTFENKIQEVHVNRKAIY